MAHLIKIGNSQGVRIPKPYIEQVEFEGRELEIKVVDQGLLITPSKTPRSNWRQQIEEAISAATYSEVDSEWLNTELDTELDSGDDEWKW